MILNLGFQILPLEVQHQGRVCLEVAGGEGQPGLGRGARMSSKRKAEQAPLTTCPITGLPINDNLSKKLKLSSTVTKKTLQNTLTNKLGWPAHKIQDSWSRDTLIQEYYTALEMQKAAAYVSPVNSPSAARAPSPAKAAPAVAKGGAREQTRSTRGRTSSSAAGASPTTASPPGPQRGFGGSPESSRSALPSSGGGGARAKSPAGRGSDGGGDRRWRWWTIRRAAVSVASQSPSGFF